MNSCHPSCSLNVRVRFGAREHLDAKLSDAKLSTERLVMALALIVIALGTLFGAIAYAPTPVIALAAVAIGGWLLAFAVRERASRARGN